MKELLWGKYRRPTFTAKLIIITAIAISLMAVCVRLVGQVLLGSIVAWWTAPIHISIAVLLVSLLEYPVKQRIITKAASHARTMFRDSLVIGITGSYGKTTTKEFMGQLLQQQYRTAMTPLHVNQTLPLANFVNSITASPEVLVVEYASYGKGNIQFDTSRLVAPHWAVLTGIAPQHLALFGSLETIVQAKFELIDALPQDGVVFYNADDKLLSTRIQEQVTREVVPFSSSDAEPWLSEVSWADSLKGRLVANILGSNVAAAIAVATRKAVTREHIIAGLETLSWLPRTLEVVEKNGVTIIDDSYSSNPHGFGTLMDVVEKEDASNKVLVTSGIIELGAASFDINHRLALQAVDVFDHVCITNKAMTDAWRQAGDIVSALDEEETIRQLRDVCQSGTLLVIEGRIPERIRKALI